MRPLFFALVCLLVASVNCQATYRVEDFPEVKLKELSESVYWRRLLHYKRKLFTGPRSGITGKQFFLSPDGDSDPYSELVATLKAFTDESLRIGGLKQPAQCAFPERYRFLKEKLGLPIRNIECKDFLEWKEGLDAKTITLVYASAYPNSPGSMFGHTLLRLNQRVAKTDRKDLLSYGVNFSALVPDKDPSIKYILFGLFGGYVGYYSASPYYMKVNEYNNSESRDMWEYDLNLSQEQVDHLVNHFWELFATAQFKYFFIDENCSYQLLTSLEVANPAWDLSDAFDGFVLPADTIKRLMKQPGAISEVKFRPSIQKQMLAKVETLNDYERAIYFDVLKERRNISEVQNPNIMEAILSYLDYVKYRDQGLSDSQQAFFRQALVQRSKIRALPENRPYKMDESSRPDKGHESSSFDGFYKHREDRGSIINLSARWGLHDLLDADRGYAHFSQIEFFGISADYLLKERKIRLNEVKFVEATSLYPYNSMDPKFSWKAGFKVDNFKDFQCDYCLGAKVSGGGGISLPYLSRRGLLYFMPLVDIEGAKALPKGFRAGPAGLIATVLGPTDSYNIQLAASTHLDLMKNFSHRVYHQFEFNQSYAFSTSWAARLSSTYIPRGSLGLRDYYELAIGGRYYY